MIRVEASFLSLLAGAFILYLGYLLLKGVEKTANGISTGLGKEKNSNFGMVIFLSLIGFVVFIIWFSTLY